MDDEQKIRDVISKLDGCREEIEQMAAPFEMTYEEFMAAADDYLATGNWVTLPFDTPDCDWDKFWELYEKVRGVKDPDESGFFSCAC